MLGEDFLPSSQSAATMTGAKEENSRKRQFITNHSESQDNSHNAPTEKNLIGAS